MNRMRLPDAWTLLILVCFLSFNDRANTRQEQLELKNVSTHKRKQQFRKKLFEQSSSGWKLAEQVGDGASYPTSSTLVPLSIRMLNTKTSFSNNCLFKCFADCFLAYLRCATSLGALLNLNWLEDLVTRRFGTNKRRTSKANTSHWCRITQADVDACAKQFKVPFGMHFEMRAVREDFGWFKLTGFNREQNTRAKFESKLRG